MKRFFLTFMNGIQNVHFRQPCYWNWELEGWALMEALSGNGTGDIQPQWPPLQPPPSIHTSTASSTTCDIHPSFQEDKPQRSTELIPQRPAYEKTSRISLKVCTLWIIEIDALRIRPDLLENADKLSFNGQILRNSCFKPTPDRQL